MKPNKACKLRENHEIHRCQLDSNKNSVLIKALSNKPIVKCEHCGAEANTGAYVCMPVKLENALAEGN